MVIQKKEGNWSAGRGAGGEPDRTKKNTLRERARSVSWGRGHEEGRQAEKGRAVKGTIRTKS